jgi:hypothetical protein
VSVIGLTILYIGEQAIARLFSINKPISKKGKIMPRDNNFGPERPKRPKQTKPTIILPSIPDTSIVVQGVTFDLQQQTDFMFGDISFHHPTSIGQFMDNGKVKILDNYYNYPVQEQSPKNILLLEVVGHFGGQQVIPLIAETKILHTLPISDEAKKRAMSEALPMATYISSEDYDIFDETTGQIDLVILQTIKEINEWLSGDHFSCSTKHPLWKHEMFDLNVASLCSHIVYLNAIMEDMKTIQPLNMQEEIQRTVKYCEDRGLDGSMIEIHKSMTEYNVNSHNEQYERFKDWSGS